MMRRGRFVAPRLEQLENRIVFALSATSLSFNAFGTAHAAGVLTAPNKFQLYEINLQAGDVITAAVNSQPGGGALQSNLRVFDATGRQLALDAQRGGDARLTFQASADGNYLVGVSSNGDDDYDPAVATSGHEGATSGMFDLDLQRQHAALMPDLAAGSFRLVTHTAAYGDTVTAGFTVDNRGGAAAGAFKVQVVLSADNLFGPSLQPLMTFSVPGLGAGQEYSPDFFTVQLKKAAGLPASGPEYLGLQIVPAKGETELNPHDQSGVHEGEDWQPLTVVTRVKANGSNHTPASPQVLGDLNSEVSGALSAGQTDWYQLKVTENVSLTATVTGPSGSTFRPRLSLTDSTGQFLFPQDSVSSLVDHLAPGTYMVAVSADSGAGRYQLTLSAVPINAPLEPLPLPSLVKGVVAADVNGDGKPDLITTDSGGVSVLLGNGDGTFERSQHFPAGPNPGSVVVADLNGDGKPDLIVVNRATGNSEDNGSIRVLLGNGDGTFGPPQTVDENTDPVSVAVADVDGDGNPDLVVANLGTYNKTNHRFEYPGIQVFMGNRYGTFGSSQTFYAGPNPSSVAVADVNGDGKPDLVVANSVWKVPSTGKYEGNGSISVLIGKGHGSFGPLQPFDKNTDPVSVAVADVNGDGKPDLVVANLGTYNKTNHRFEYPGIQVFLGKGDGTFYQPQKTLDPGFHPYSVGVADVNGDGKPDILTYGYNSHFIGTLISVVLGKGNGTFQAQRVSQAFAVRFKGASPGVESVAIADINGDGKPDIVDIGESSGEVGLQIGNGDGTFQPLQLSQSFSTATQFSGVVVADLNGDRKPDIITIVGGSRFNISSLQGNGDGTFQSPQITSPKKAPPDSNSIAVVDINGDGKPDLIYGKTVFLGNGDGTFNPNFKYLPAFGYLADVNGDGLPDIESLPDIITSSYDKSKHSTTLSVLLNNGALNFGTARKIASLAYDARVVAVTDVNGDRKPDIVTESYEKYNTGSPRILNVLLGKGDGYFQPAGPITNIGYSQVLSVTDVNGDRKPDIVTASLEKRGQSSTSVSVRLGNGHGTFGPALASPSLKFYVNGAFVVDVNGDGKPDIVTGRGTAASSNDIQELLGKGNGTFQAPKLIRKDDYPTVDAVTDINGDGRADLITSGKLTVRVLLGNADGSFTSASPITTATEQNTPYLADLTGDGIPDSVVLNSAGDILFRKGLKGSDNLFAPLKILNPGRPARDLTVLQTASGMAIATADANPDPTLSSPGHFVYTVSLYRVAADGTPLPPKTAFTTNLLPTRIVAAALTANGLDDLIVANSFNNSIQIAFQQKDFKFSKQPNGKGSGIPLTLRVGQAPSDITVADFNNDHRLDIAVSNVGSGDVSVFLNDPQHSFTRSYRLRAGTGLYGLDMAGATPEITSVEQSVSLVAGEFTGTKGYDLVVVNHGSHQISVLANDGNGGFARPRSSLTTFTTDDTGVITEAGPVVAGYFHGPKKPEDLALLLKDTGEVWIYTGSGYGTFRKTFSIAVGSQPTGLNLYHNPQTHLDDLLVGDAFGDVLYLQDNGNGTFQIVGRRTTLAGKDIDGHIDVLVANQQKNSVSIQAPKPGTSQFSSIGSLANTLAPGAVEWAPLEQKSPYYDAVVLASGGNEVFVYRLIGFDASGNPIFAARLNYSVGTNPVSVTIQDVNGDHIPDLIVSNQGSNDVSIKFGSWDKSGYWAGTRGPRIKSGGSGPIAAQAVFPAGGGLPELVITNGQSGQLAVLPGRGEGTFDDRNPQIINLPDNPVITQGPTFGSTGLGVMVTATGLLLGFNLNLNDPVFTPLLDEVVAAQALADGNVVAVLSNGTVVELAPAEGGLAEDILGSLPGTQSEPSALDVLKDESLVLVTDADGNQVFAFGIPELQGPPVLPEITPSPLVEVTPLLGEPLTLVVTVTAGPGPGFPAIPAGNGVAAEGVDESAAELLISGLSALGVVPAWVPALLTRLPGSAPAEDPAGDAVVEAGSMPGAAAETPPPALDSLDLEKQLRELDLNPPAPSPDHPDPASGWPWERRGRELMARLPAVDAPTPLADLAVASEERESPQWMAGLVEVVEALAADLGAAATPPQVPDAVPVQTPSPWGEESWRLLGLAGLALWPWPLCGCQSESEAQLDPETERERPANGRTGGGKKGAS
jgi:hypothetical protein